MIIGVPGMSLILSKGCVRRSTAGGRFWRSEVRAGGAGVNISKGQQVWLHWDLAADVLLSSGCLPLEGAGEARGITSKTF